MLENLQRLHFKIEYDAVQIAIGQNFETTLKNSDAIGLTYRFSGGYGRYGFRRTIELGLKH